MARMSPRVFLTVLLLSSTLLVDCSDKRHDCSWTATCEEGGTDAGGQCTGGKTQAGGRTSSGGNASGGVAGLGAAGSGTAGTSSVSTAGTAGQAPCNGTCAAPTPICRTDTNLCVACTDNTHCSGATPVCDTSKNVCVGCTSKEHCSAPTGICTSDSVCVECVSPADCTYSTTKTACKQDSKTCVECTSNVDCKGVAGKPACDATTNLCVGCLNSSHCTDPAKPQCDTAAKSCVACLSNADCKTAAASKCDVTAGSPTANTCLPCSLDVDCSQVTGKTVCLAGTTGQPNQCVQCSVQNESACGGNSCNPKTSTCTTTAKGSRKTCQSCLADSECGDAAGAVDPNKRCVPMTFNGAPHGTGGYCLQRASTVTSCTRPYSIGFDAVSLSGASLERYCGLNQSTTTCEALLDLFSSTTCTEDTSCGGGVGGLCRQMGSGTNPPFLCTIPCGTDSQCPSGNTCSDSTNGYCR